MDAIQFQVHLGHHMRLSACLWLAQEKLDHNLELDLIRGLSCLCISPYWIGNSIRCPCPFIQHWLMLLWCRHWLSYGDLSKKRPKKGLTRALSLLLANRWRLRNDWRDLWSIHDGLPNSVLVLWHLLYLLPVRLYHGLLDHTLAWVRRWYWAWTSQGNYRSLRRDVVGQPAQLLPGVEAQL